MAKETFAGRVGAQSKDIETIKYLIADSVEQSFIDGLNSPDFLEQVAKERKQAGITKPFKIEIIDARKELPDIKTEGKAARAAAAAKLITQHLPDRVIVRSDTELNSKVMPKDSKDKIDVPEVSKAFDTLNKAGKRTKFGRAGAGVDNLDGATKAGFEVYNTPGCNSAAVVELQLYMMIKANPELCNKLENLEKYTATDSKRMTQSDTTKSAYTILKSVYENPRFKDGFDGKAVNESLNLETDLKIFEQTELPEFKGKNFFCLGANGEIGKRVTSLAQSLGMTVSTVVQRSITPEYCEEHGIVGLETKSGLDNGLRMADYVSINIPQDSKDPSTIGFINRERINLLANNGRGNPVILATARAGHIAKETTIPGNVTLGLDATGDEGKALNLTVKGTLIHTKKVGAKTKESGEKVAAALLDCERQFATTGACATTVNKQQSNLTDQQIVERMLVGSPTPKPSRADFSSGPTPKDKEIDWRSVEAEWAAWEENGASHRTTAAVDLLKQYSKTTLEFYEAPQGFGAGVIVGGGTAGINTAMENAVGDRNITVLAFDAFSKDWAKTCEEKAEFTNRWIQDAKNEVYCLNSSEEYLAQKKAELGEKYDDYFAKRQEIASRKPITTDVRSAKYGELPNLQNIDPKSDLVFVSNGTTSGVAITDYSFIPKEHEGFIIIDGTSGLGSVEVDWEKLNGKKVIVIAPGQKTLATEGGVCDIIASPEALKALGERKDLPWPIDKDRKLAGDQKTIDAVFSGGKPINTPAMETVFKMLYAKNHYIAKGAAEEISGLKWISNKVAELNGIVTDWIKKSGGKFAHMAVNAGKSPSVTIKITDSDINPLTGEAIDEATKKTIAEAAVTMAIKQGYGKSIKGYEKALIEHPGSLRYWCSASTDPVDLKRGLEGYEYCYNVQKELHFAKAQVAQQIVDTHHTTTGGSMDLQAAKQQVEEMLAAKDGSGAAKFKGLLDKARENMQSQVKEQEKRKRSGGGGGKGA